VILELLPSSDEPMVWNEARHLRLLELRDLLNEVEVIRRMLMEGEDAQIRRILADGMKLARKLREALEARFCRGDWPERRPECRGSGPAGSRTAGEHPARHHATGRLVVPLSGYHRLRDALADLQRAEQQLAAGGLIDLDWMRTDTNPITRRWYRQYQGDIAKLSELPVEQQPPVVQQLRRISTRAGHGHRSTGTDRGRVSLAGGTGPLADLAGRCRGRDGQTTADPAEAAETSVRTVHRHDDRRARQVQRIARQDSRLSAEDRSTDRRRSEPECGAVHRAVPPGHLARHPQELVELSENVLVLSLMQARDRAETVSLIDVDLHPAMALEIARVNRRDWMNRRAALVDTWRLIEFNADNLENSLDVVFSGDMRNRDRNNPFSLDSSTGTLRVGLRFDTPLIRLSERNTYRQALIEYQQARRSYYQFEDGINRSLRDTLRTLQLNQQNFEIRREAVRAADLQIELNEDIRRLQEASRQPTGPTAARDAVSALSDLLQAQNDFLSVWVTYELLRRTLDLDLGTMQLDAEGMWIDPGPIGPATGYPGVEVDLEDPCWPGPANIPAGGHPALWCSIECDAEPQVAPGPRVAEVGNRNP
jgi:hypothetical protein